MRASTVLCPHCSAIRCESSHAPRVLPRRFAHATSAPSSSTEEFDVNPSTPRKATSTRFHSSSERRQASVRVRRPVERAHTREDTSTCSDSLCSSFSFSQCIDVRTCLSQPNSSLAAVAVRTRRAPAVRHWRPIAVIRVRLMVFHRVRIRGARALREMLTSMFPHGRACLEQDEDSWPARSQVWVQSSVRAW